MFKKARLKYFIEINTKLNKNGGFIMKKLLVLIITTALFVVGTAVIGAEYFSTKNGEFVKIKGILKLNWEPSEEKEGCRLYNLDFFSENKNLEKKLKTYCQGYFQQHNRAWNIFLFSQLLSDPKYMNASEKFK